MPYPNSERVLAAIRAINTASTPREIIDKFVGYIGTFGFERVYLGQLVNPANVHLKDIMFISNWPEELTEHRIQNLAIIHDPIAKCALKSKRPFRWSDAHKYASTHGQRVVDMVHDYGIHDGWMFPMHALDSISGGVSLGGKDPEISSDELLELEIVAQTAYYCIEDMMGPFPYQRIAQLSPRETECVQLAAGGKSNWEIAEILGLAEDSVNKTLRRAYTKLDATNRAHAVSLSIASGQILM